MLVSASVTINGPPLSGLFDKSIQKAESKQIADQLKNTKFSFQISLLYAFSVLKTSKRLIEKSKQTAESKQISDHLKNYKYLVLTSKP